jgi:hypothetical protein
MAKELLEGESVAHLVSSEKVLQYYYVCPHTTTSYYYLHMCPRTNHLNPCRLTRTEAALCPRIDSREIDALDEELFTRMLTCFTSC